MEEQRKLNIDVADSISQLREYLKEFEVKTKRYNIFFRGKSFEFDGYRPYTEGDDVSYIDWKASARSDKPLVKQYKEEENMKILFIVDVSENMIFGSTKKLKCEYAAEIVLGLSYILSIYANKVAYILFNDKVVDFSIPRGGLNSFYRFSDIISKTDTYGGRSKIDVAIDFALDNFDASISAVVLISDFLGFNKNMKRYLDLISNKYETLGIMVRDPLDKTLPNIQGEFILEDPNTGQQLLVEPGIARKTYERHALKQETFVKESFKNSSIDLLSLSTDEAWVIKLTNFIKDRAASRVTA